MREWTRVGAMVRVRERLSSSRFSQTCSTSNREGCDLTLRVGWCPEGGSDVTLDVGWCSERK